MTFTPDILADGQIPTTESALYTAPTSTRTLVKTISVHNTSATPQTVVLYIRPSAGTSRVLFRWVLSQHERGVYAESIALDAGDAIRGETTTATAVDYLVFGVEQS